MQGTTKQSDVTIGLDLGDRRSQAVVLDAGGAEIEERSVATTWEAFEEYVEAVLVIEVGTHSPWVSRLFKERRFDVIVANPRQVRLISASQHKTDHFDAHMLARLGRADPKLLSPVEHRGEQDQRDRALLQARDGLVRCRVLLINQARGMTKSLGARVPKCSPTVFPRRVRETFGEALFPGLPAMLATIGGLTTQLDGLDAGRGLALSANGLVVAWSSAASNLVPADTNGVRDIFVTRPCTAPTPTPSPLPSPTATPTATSTPTPEPTATQIQRCICAIVRRRVPAAVIADAILHPELYFGWLALLDPGKPPGPANPPRKCLTLREVSLDYHLLWDRPVWRVGCP